jgi:hypothetical protein
MMNPFLQFPPEKTGRKRTEMHKELDAQVNIQLAQSHARRIDIGLWAGNLLIRMGKKLTERDIDMETCKENA